MDADLGHARLERLLSHSGWLDLLARRLVHDPATAEDLVQDTWHAALRSPRSDLHSERGWLATLIANLARERAREEQSRREREQRSASDERIEGPDALVERAESRRKLLGHVLALDEPYRGTLLARYVEGRSAAQIARASGVNESTVRTRLSRGLERLRTRLASEGREDPMLGLGPLILATDTQRVGWNAASAEAASKSATWMGASVMGTGAKFAWGAAALLCTWLVWRQGPPDPIPRDLELASDARPEPSSILAPEAGAGSRPSREALEKPASAQTAPESPAPAKTAGLDGTLDIVFSRDGMRIAGVSAWLLPQARAGWPVPGRTVASTVDLLDVHFDWPADSPRAASDSAGVAAFRGIPVACYFVGFDLSPTASRPLRFALGTPQDGLRANTRHEIRLGGAAVHGRVFDERGFPRAAVGVMVSTRAPGPPDFLMLASIGTTDQRGEYRFSDLRSGEYDVVMALDGRFDGRGETQRRIVTLNAEEDRELDFGSASPGPVWSGRLLNAFGEPFAGTPRIHLDAGDRELTSQVDSAGRFRFSISPGSWRLRVFAAGCPQGGFSLGMVELGDFDLERDVIVPGARLRGRVNAARLGETIPAGLHVSVRPKGHDYPAAFRDALVSQEGSYQLDGLDPGPWLVGVWPGALEAPVEITVLEGVRAVDRDLRWIAK